MAIDGQSYNRLQMALISAFPTQGALRQMLRFRLDLSLDDIAFGASYRELVFNVLQWAISQGRLSDLVDGARLENPGNPELQAVAADLKEARPPTDDFRSLVRLLRWADASGQLGRLIALACGPDGPTVDPGEFIARTVAAATERAGEPDDELLEVAERQPGITKVGRGYALESAGTAAPWRASTARAASVETSSVVVLRKEMLNLAKRYESIREELESGPRRTALLDRLASHMRMLAPGLLEMLPELVRSDEPGQRLAAIAMLQEHPHAGHVDWLGEQLSAPKNAFLGYHAAIALRSAARAETVDRDALRNAIESSLRAIQGRHPADFSTLNRYRILREALALVTAAPVTSHRA